MTTGQIIHRVRTQTEGAEGGPVGSLLSAMLENVWAMEENALQRIFGAIMRHEMGVRLGAEEMAKIEVARGQNPEKIAAALGMSGASGMGEDRGYAMWGNIAVVPIGGIIAKHASQVNGRSQARGTATETIRRIIRAARADEGVRGTLLHIESPGGTISGVETLAAEIYDLREEAARASDGGAGSGGGKPIWAYFDDVGASAAYWIGSQASRLLTSTTSEVGSIGVYMIAYDTSRMYEDAGVKAHLVRYGKGKGVGAAGVPIDSEALAKLQRSVDDAGEAFVAAVARGRGISVEDARKLATGETWMGQKAKAAGIVDDVVNSVEVAAEMMRRAVARGTAAGGSGGGGKRAGETASAIAVGGGADTNKQAAEPVVGSGVHVLGVAGSLNAGEPAEDDMARRLLGIAGIAAGLGPLLAPLAGEDGGGIGAVEQKPAGTSTDKSATDHVAAERKRSADILKRASYPQFAGNAEIRKLAEQCVTEGKSAAEFADLAVAKLAAEPTGHAAGGGDADFAITREERDVKSQAATNFVIAKYLPENVQALHGEKGDKVATALGFKSKAEAIQAFAAVQASGLMGSSIREIGEQFALKASGLSSIEALRARYPGEQIMAVAFGSSSDLPGILSNAMNKSMLAARVEAETVWENFCRTGTATDFKTATVYSLSEAAGLELIPEGQTPSEGTFNERGHGIAVESYGKRHSYTYKQWRNDDLGALRDIPRLYGIASRRLPDSLLIALLESNSGSGPTMADGNPLIYARTNQDNTLTTGAISETTLDEAYVKMRKIRGFGKDASKAAKDAPFLDVMPDRLLVPVNRMTTAMKWFTNEKNPGTANNDENPFKGKFRPYDSARLTSTTRWWAFANPAVAPVIEMRFLDGVQVPMVTPINDGDPLSFRMQFTLPGVGVAAIDWIGVAMNAGA